jgi:serine/threonine protein kinase
MYGLEALLTGRTLGGRYRVEKVIGRGGMGAVYRAADERLGRAVAVKVIAAPTANAAEEAKLRARFHREARAAAALHHPNVVAVFDYGTDPDVSLDYIVMELLQGEDLAGRLARTGPPARKTGLCILREAARGLAAGHRAGMVHRDIKPGNIFLEQGDEPDEPMVRVLDFGIAQVAHEEGTQMQLTEFGRSPYSPAYASPEQLAGEDRLTPASDVFSLGAVGYNLLTGVRCFTSGEPDVMAREVAESVAQLDRRAPRLDPAVRAALLRSLALRPADRFPHAGAFADALNADRTNAGMTYAPPRPASAPASTSAGMAQDWTEMDATRALGSAPPPAPPASTCRAETPRAYEATEFYQPPARPAGLTQQPVFRPPAPQFATRTPQPIPSAPFPRPEPVPAFTAYQPPARIAVPAAAVPETPLAPPRKRWTVGRVMRGLWEFTVSTVVMGLFVGSWAVAAKGVMDHLHGAIYAGVAGAVFFTPLAVHRLTGSRGRYFMVLVASALATGGALRVLPPGTDIAIRLAGIFGGQVVASFLVARLTRRKVRDAAEEEI